MRRRTKVVITAILMVFGSILAWILLVWLPVARIALSFVTGSGSTPLDVFLPADPTFHLSASLEGTTVTGAGETSLPDGSRVQVWASFWGDAPGIYVTDFPEAIVTGGRFSATFDLNGWPAGPVAVNALFQVDETQPAEVGRRYGADGSGMSGPRVKFDDDTGTWALQDWQTVQFRPPGPAPVVTPPPAAASSPGSFAKVGRMTAGRTNHAAARLIDGRVLLVGGDMDVTTDPLTLRPTAELFDPATDVFTPTAPMTAGREHLAASLLADGRVLVTGGYDAGGDPLASAELFDPATGKFAATGPMTVARADHTATLLADGRVLVVGGTGGGSRGRDLRSRDRRLRPHGLVRHRTELPHGDAARRRPGPRHWRGGLARRARLGRALRPRDRDVLGHGSMATVRQLHAAVLLSDGRVLVAGGLGSEDQWQLASAELYDPATGTFTATGQLVKGRNYLTLTLLADGRVLVAGGFSRAMSFR